MYGTEIQMSTCTVATVKMGTEFHKLPFQAYPTARSIGQIPSATRKYVKLRNIFYTYTPRIFLKVVEGG